LKFPTFLPETKTIDIDFGHDILTVEYRPSAMVVASDDDDEDESEDGNPLAERICQVIVSWNAEGPIPYIETGGKAIGSIVAEGQTIPLRPEVVQYIAVPALAGILTELNRDALPDPKGTRKRLHKRG